MTDQTREAIEIANKIIGKLIADMIIHKEDVIENSLSALRHLVSIAERVDRFNINEIIRQYEGEGKYGMSFCETCNQKRSPNSIGHCDYCGGEVRLRTLAHAIVSYLEGEKK